MLHRGHKSRQRVSFAEASCFEKAGRRVIPKLTAAEDGLAVLRDVVLLDQDLDGALVLRKELPEAWEVLCVTGALVVEDAHWLDNSSAEILGSLLIERLPGILVTSRLPLDETFGEAWRGAAVIEMPAFTLEEVRAMIELSLPARATDELAAQLHSASGGNGMFLEGLRFGFKPSANSVFQIQFQDVRSPLQYGNDPFARYRW